eukprot:scaffold80721_cov33-Tisochrysis_lutea.AAC.2
MLMRLALGHMLRALCDANLDESMMREVAEIFHAGPLNLRAPRGIQFFLTDNFLTALRKVLPENAPHAAWMTLIEPFFKLLGHTEERHLLERLTEHIINPFLDAPKNPESQEERGGKEEDDLRPLPWLLPELSERLFDLASDPSTCEDSREHLYKLQRIAEERANEHSSTNTAKPASNASESSRAVMADNGNSGIKAPKQKTADGAAAYKQEALRGMIGRQSPQRSSATGESATRGSSAAEKKGKKGQKTLTSDGPLEQSSQEAAPSKRKPSGTPTKKYRKSSTPTDERKTERSKETKSTPKRPREREVTEKRVLRSARSARS